MSRSLVPFLAIFALCACSNGQNGGRRQVPPDHPSWSAIVEGGLTRLAFGPPASDEVALTLECAPRSGRVKVSGPVAPGASRLVLASDGATASIAGSRQADPEAGVDVVTGEAGARDAALSAFARTGRLMRMDGDGAVALPAAGRELGLVRAFLDRCAH